MHNTITNLVQSYGYVVLFLLVGLESLGVPLPGETALVTAAALAATGHLSIYAVVMTAAAAAILGDNGGYWIGRRGGLALVRRYGRALHVDQSKIAQAHDFFKRHGAKTVFLGRFIALLRTWAAVLSIEHFHPDLVSPGDIVGIGISSGNCIPGYRALREAKSKGATVIMGGIHATIFPEEHPLLLCAGAGRHLNGQFQYPPDR